MLDDGEMPGTIDLGHAESWMDQSVFQDIYVEVNVLTFVFSGSFAENAFQDAAFHFTDVQLDVGIDALNSASLDAANSDAGYGQHIRQAVDQQTDTRINLLQLLVTGDVRENALEGLDFYFDGVEIDVRVATANDADLTAVNHAARLPGEAGQGSGADQQVVDQRIHAEVNVLTFEFSGTFGGDAFREADFYFTDLWIGARVDAVNSVALSATDGSPGGGTAGRTTGQAVSQFTGSEFSDLNFDYSGVYDGDAFRDADFAFNGVRIEAVIGPVNDATLPAANNAGLGLDVSSPPPPQTGMDSLDLVWA